MAGEGLHKPKRHPEAANTAKDLGCDATDSWSRWLLVRSSFAAPRLILIAFHRSHGSRRNGVNLRQERPSPGLRPPSPRWRGARGARHEVLTPQQLTIARPSPLLEGRRCRRRMRGA